MSQHRTLILALAVLAGGIAASTVGAEAAPKTQPALTVSGKSYYDKQQARSSAVGRWEKQAAIKYGLDFSDWGQAKHKGFLCNEDVHKKNGRTLWTCKALGQPFANIKTCKNQSVVAKNTRANKNKAQSETIKTWEKLAAINFGVKYSFWKNASDKSIKCSKQGSGSKQVFVCRYQAKPCI
ncbi:hypothetical protein [Oricola sp.]|mgnify:CR=1 FL=1|uniref:hypothetical protein n=1 Tax=Oricola sp. TaxID=1979950 RepID=UPI00320BC47E|nr:hypothetical protein [Oricola sp.]|tara:strand:- start:2811 stop:3353 length:543 start_codon:yes stop_codon:yes gene_type:complete